MIEEVESIKIAFGKSAFHICWHGSRSWMSRKSLVHFANFGGIKSRLFSFGKISKCTKLNIIYSTTL